jgi:thioredoxin 1
MDILLIVIAALVVGFFGLQILMVRKMQKAKGKPAPQLDGRVGALISKGKKVMFYFYSPSCRMCSTTTPIIEELSKVHTNVFKIDISQDMATARKFGIMGTPSTVVVENGIVSEFKVGPVPQQELANLLA